MRHKMQTGRAKMQLLSDVQVSRAQQQDIFALLLEVRRLRDENAELAAELEMVLSTRIDAAS